MRQAAAGVHSGRREMVFGISLGYSVDNRCAQLVRCGAWWACILERLMKERGRQRLSQKLIDEAEELIPEKYPDDMTSGMWGGVAAVPAYAWTHGKRFRRIVD